MDSTKFFLPVAIIIAAVLISGTILFTQSDSDNSKGVALIPDGDQIGGAVDVSVDDDPFLGPEDAKVTIVEFSDFQCPFCRKFWSDSFLKIKSEYIDSGKSVKIVFRDLPLSFHPMAIISAQVTQCANEQELYWEMHDKIFEEQNKLGTNTIQYSKDDLLSWAGQIGLDMEKIENCIDEDKYIDEIQNDVLDASKYGATGTPTLFINGKKIVGAQPYEVFKAAIESELAK